METRKSLVMELAEVLDRHMPRRAAHSADPQPARSRSWLTWLGKQLMPNLGSVVLVFVMLSVFPGLAAPNQSPAATSTSTIPYQGRLADSAGNPVTGMQNMEFRIYDVPTGGVPLWEELWTGGNAVSVSDGLFSVLLGSLNTGLTAVVQAHNALYLGVTVGTDSEMSPRVQLGSVPFSMQALTVPDGSVTTAKLADDAVTAAKIVVGAVGSSEVADNSLTANDLADDSVGSSEVTDNSLTASDLAANSVGSSEIANGAVTQEKAPSLIKSANGNNEIILSGNQTFPGSDANGFITITYPCFPNGVRTFFAINGHWDANHSYVVAHNGAGQCSAQIKLSSPTSNPIRINWLAIGN